MDDGAEGQHCKHWQVVRMDADSMQHTGHTPIHNPGSMTAETNCIPPMGRVLGLLHLHLVSQITSRPIILPGLAMAVPSAVPSNVDSHPVFSTVLYHSILCGPRDRPSM